MSGISAVGGRSLDALQWPWTFLSQTFQLIFTTYHLYHKQTSVIFMLQYSNPFPPLFLFLLVLFLCCFSFVCVLFVSVRKCGRGRV